MKYYLLVLKAYNKRKQNRLLIEKQENVQKHLHIDY